MTKQPVVSGPTILKYILTPGQTHLVRATSANLAKICAQFTEMPAGIGDFASAVYSRDLYPMAPSLLADASLEAGVLHGMAFALGLNLYELLEAAGVAGAAGEAGPTRGGKSDEVDDVPRAEAGGVGHDGSDLHSKNTEVVALRTARDEEAWDSCGEPEWITTMCPWCERDSSMPVGYTGYCETCRESFR